MDYATLLALLGEGSAHPGGFQATKELIGRIKLPPGTKVLEAGCGTGRTACYLAGLGCDVTAMDRNASMIEKAKQRAGLAGASIRIIQADAASMPFPDGAFDVVLVESVTAFTEGGSALREYRRVLKPGGVLYDHEMALARKLPPSRLRELRSFYGLRHLRTVPEWLKLVRESRFRKLKVSRFAPMDQPAIDRDSFRVIERELLLNREALRMMMKNERLMNKFSKLMGGIVITAWK
ncbi:MAG TPA: methyltransferase domain-containing protein [Paenibacillus sp.]|uniref:methyltransferase domain-containing protein n=1 Tax=Paenibacillus sp. TaxID=58172 RepID=UPI0028D2E02B|nr:methyltransferase domain-containing protein [Paenibacillus sp.]HUC94007.1 methyltransferase domain-containing protein [Paenibacillus sp.]